MTFKPESYNLVGWERRILETLTGYLKMYVDDTHHMPSADEYVEMAKTALENTTKGRAE